MSDTSARSETPNRKPPLGGSAVVPPFVRDRRERLAQKAVEAADALIRELDREPGEPAD